MLLAPRHGRRNDFHARGEGDRALSSLYDRRGERLRVRNHSRVGGPFRGLRNCGLGCTMLGFCQLRRSGVHRRDHRAGGGGAHHEDNPRDHYVSPQYVRNSDRGRESAVRESYAQRSF